MLATRTTGAGPVEPWLAEAWKTYAARFVTPEGRVVDNANGYISHSEGQGYAMLIAARAGDADTFARLWAWTQSNLFVRDDPLAAWVWDPNTDPHVRDTDDASDGNLLIAWALIEGGAQWNRRDYGDSARRIALAAGKMNLVQSRYGLVLLPSSKDFGADERPDGPVINLSYWVFPAFPRLARVAPGVDWTKLAANGISVIRRARFGPLRLPSDWISLAKEAARPADNFPNVFGYDVIRVPLYLAWGHPKERKALAIFEPVLRLARAGGPTAISIPSGKPAQPLGGHGYEAVIALLDCALNGTPFPNQYLTISADLYYPTTLHMLSLLALRESYPACLK